MRRLPLGLLLVVVLFVSSRALAGCPEDGPPTCPPIQERQPESTTPKTAAASAEVTSKVSGGFQNAAVNAGLPLPVAISLQESGQEQSGVSRTVGETQPMPRPENGVRGLEGNATVFGANAINKIQDLGAAVLKSHPLSPTEKHAGQMVNQNLSKEKARGGASTPGEDPADPDAHPQTYKEMTQALTKSGGYQGPDGFWHYSNGTVAQNPDGSPMTTVEPEDEPASQDGGESRAPAFNPRAVQILRTAEQNELRQGAAPSPDSSAGLAKGYLHAGSPQDAERVVSRTLAADPKNEPALTIRAQARALIGNAEGSVQDARLALALNPDNLVARSLAAHHEALGAAASRMKKLDGKALGSLQFESGAGDSGPQASRSMLAALAPAGEPRGPEVASGAGRPSGLTQTQTDAVATVGQLKAFARYKDAYEKASVGDFTGALLPAMQAVDLAEKKAKPLVLKAFVENRIPEQPPAALQDANQALTLEPENPAALREKAYAELQTGQLQAARADIEHAVSLEPASGLGLYYRGLIAEKEDRLSDAQADFARAVSLEPALRALVAPALQRLAPPPSSPGRRGLFRGGAIAASLVLILLGMLGTAPGQRAVSTMRTILAGRKAAELPTVRDPAAEAAAPGALLAGNYRLKRELGRGGMGVVYEAMDEALQRTVAVKRLQRENGLGAEDMQRLLQEARLVAKLKHPRIAEIYNVVEDGDLYLIFEYVDGKPLDRALAERVRLSPQEARRALGDIAAAIGHAHAQKVIHRDLKPSNVMLEAGGGAKVMDFGIAHRSNAATVLTRTSVSGTPPYMPPEQMMGSVSKASDLYALAVMAYELLSGRRPFEGPDFLEQKLNRQFTPPSALGLPAKLDGFFARALDPDPTKRAPSAEEFLSLLDAALS